MTKLESLDKQIDALYERRRSNLMEVKRPEDCISRLITDRNRVEFNCPCVRRNGDIGIHVEDDYQFQFRKTLVYNRIISDTISANKHCTVCHGGGKAPVAKW